jgi:hypothetical protein
VFEKRSEELIISTMLWAAGSSWNRKTIALGLL